MRMISERDDRIMARLARAAGNDMDLVREALDAVSDLAKKENRQIAVDEAVEKIEKLRSEKKAPIAA